MRCKILIEEPIRILSIALPAVPKVRSAAGKMPRIEDSTIRLLYRVLS